MAEPISGESDWLITEILERTNELTRPSMRGRVEVLAANVSCLTVVAATVPEADWFIVDRYIAAAELMHAKVVIVFNKTDLRDRLDSESSALQVYRELGYPTVLTSAISGEGIPEMANLLCRQVGIFVGQSGVGKSSLINCISADADLRTGEVSESRREGRHTTVNSEMIDLPDGGSIIDSPGVRDYAPAIPSIADVGQGYVEIKARAPDCRFANCRHLREPACAVKAALEIGEVDGRRYESYKRLIALTERLAEGRY